MVVIAAGWRRTGAEWNFDSGSSTKFTTTDDERFVQQTSAFEIADQGGDIVEVGAYKRSLNALAKADRSVKMLWQHNPTEPIGVWDEVREDARGLYVKGRLLGDVARAREAASLLVAVVAVTAFRP